VIDNELCYNNNTWRINDSTKMSSSTTTTNSSSSTILQVVPIRFIDFERFKKLSEMPRFPENADLCVPMESIDRDNSLIVFISHCWMRGHSATEGYDGRAHPDNATNDKFKLCLSGIEKVKSNFAPGMSHCYVWLDFGCLNQDTDPTAEMGGRLDKVIGFCDCLFSPIYGINQSKSTAVNNFYDGYQVSSWNGNRGYTNKAWCRLEMFYAANIPNTLNTPARVNKFKHGLHLHASNNVRPHLLYGSSEMEGNQQPKLLPPLQNSFYDQLDPMQGLLTNEEHDRPKIKELVELLKPYMKVVQSEYIGNKSTSGKKNGRGVLQFASGDRYEGEFKASEMHGHGVLRYADGDVYEGDFKDGKSHGQGVFTYADGDVYTGEFVNDKQQGTGIFKYANGDVYEGRFEDGEMHGRGVYIYADGDRYEGRFEDGEMHGCGVYIYANGDVYTGEFVNDKQQGRGVMKRKDGSVVHDGMWLDGDPSGL